MRVVPEMVVSGYIITLIQCFAHCCVAEGALDTLTSCHLQITFFFYCKVERVIPNLYSC